MSLALPNYHALGVLLLVLLALVLFSRDRIPLETSSLVVLAILTIGFQVFPYVAPDGRELTPTDFYAGFGHQALIAVCSLMILGHGLIRSGALEPVGRGLAISWRRAPKLSMLATLLVCAVLSAFINNTPIVVMLLPILIGVALRTGQSPSGMLLPVGLISIVGGMSTTIGTSTNLLVVSVAADMGVAPFRMFDFIVPAAIAGAVSVIYLWLIAPRLIPERQVPMQSTVKRLYTAQIRLGKSSDAVGRKLAEAIERCSGNLKVEKIQRGPGVFVTPLPDVTLKAGDRITTTDTRDNLREFAHLLGGRLFSGDVEVDDTHPLGPGDQKIAEVAVTPQSRLVGSRISEARLLSRYGLRLLALHRYNREDQTQTRSTGLDNTVLRSGDVLLVQSSDARLAHVKDGGDLLVLDGSVNLPKTSKAPIALAIMAAVVVVAAFGILPIAISALSGVLAMLLSRCLDWKEAMNALSIQVVMIIVASLALGAALMRTGGADWLAQIFVALSFGIPAWGILGLLMLAMAALTNVVSNNAAAVIGTPIAISLAQQMMLPAEPFVLAVLFGSNLSFATPMAYQTNLLVMNAGGYKFNDFVRVGAPLMLLLWVVLTLTLTYAYQI
ncbi:MULTISPECIES: SLC13 family permease [unclassified Wenzhouxiangella]|uniref:SLC13 family permease n=1 Tax=unclassified Wenzhouxiangella TaxID=2613841 RepID=UPI000E326D36|nr:MULTISPECIES: SLC13 family permease [unclassified Wenzhouxiangella]RFF27906.1 SLC13 family permease [Wenzhouxiangella sp. 15181]RFP67219.1 SLC13 family permease [Wenzhouxiangella sp. 15190]